MSAIISSNIFSSPFSLFSFWDYNYTHGRLFLCCRKGLRFCPVFSNFFFFQFFKLGNFYWSISKFTGFFYIISFLFSSSSDLFWKFYILYFLVLELKAGSLLCFYFSAQVFYIFHIFFYAFEHNYNSCLKFLICQLQHLGYLGIIIVFFLDDRLYFSISLLNFYCILNIALLCYGDSGFYSSEEVYLGTGWVVVYFGFCLSRQLA